MEPPLSDPQKPIHLGPGLLALPRAPVVELGDSFGEGEPAVNQDFFLKDIIVLSVDQGKCMVGSMCFVSEEWGEDMDPLSGAPGPSH